LGKRNIVPAWRNTKLVDQAKEMAGRDAGLFEDFREQGILYELVACREKKPPRSTYPLLLSPRSIGWIRHIQTGPWTIRYQKHTTTQVANGIRGENWTLETEKQKQEHAETSLLSVHDRGIGNGDKK
jgi:hypothetical protein